MKSEVNSLLTQEQEEIVKCSMKLKKEQILKVNAFAGTGKTTTLIEIAKANKSLKFLYLAFNNSIVKAAKKSFPSNVDVVTLHSLAYRYLKGKPKIRNNDYDALTLIEILNIEESKTYLAHDVLKLFKFYCISSKQNISDFQEHLIQFNDDVFFYAIKLWDLMLENNIEITHDFYLKLFSLNNSAMNDLSTRYDCFLLDEAQDSNEVTLAMFKKLKGKKILVGDKYQQIYQFRGSVNAMEKVVADYDYFLTFTFRCSHSVVEQANEILKKYLMSEKLLISKQSGQMSKNNKVAYIARTNATLIELIDTFKDEPQGFYLTRNANEIFNTAINLYYFLNNEFKKISKEFAFLKKFISEDDLLDYIEDNDLIELKTNMKIAKRYKGYLFVLKKEAEEKSNIYSNIVMTTAHACKGLEWDRVVIMKDFKDLELVDEDKLFEEANLLYVAITRAKYYVDFLSDE